jgi:biofilm PGA synthesis protein PgaD
MEKSRSRTRPRRPLIIERPDLQSPSQRVVSTALTLFFWAIWVYLWLPLIGLLGWVFGVDRFYTEMIRLEGYRGVIDLVAFFGLVVTGIVGVLFAWALYNLARFRGRERRRAAAPLTLADFGMAAGVAPGVLSTWQHARMLRVGHGDDGRIVEVLPSPIGTGLRGLPPAADDLRKPGRRPRDSVVAREAA